MHRLPSSSCVTARTPASRRCAWRSAPASASRGSTASRDAPAPRTLADRRPQRRRRVAGRRSAPDAGADLVQLREEREVERAAQEVDPGRAAGAGFLPDGALDDLQVTEAPLLEVVLQVDELLTGLVDAPVLVRLGIHTGEHV